MADDERLPHTQPVTIRFTQRERRVIEHQQRKAETFGACVRRLLFAAYPALLKDRSYTSRVGRTISPKE